MVRVTAAGFEAHWWGRTDLSDGGDEPAVVKAVSALMGLVALAAAATLHLLRQIAIISGKPRPPWPKIW